jgi:hypothetical protein
MTDICCQIWKFCFTCKVIVLRHSTPLYATTNIHPAASHCTHWSDLAASTLVLLTLLSFSKLPNYIMACLKMHSLWHPLAFCILKYSFFN